MAGSPEALKGSQVRLPLDRPLGDNQALGFEFSQGSGKRLGFVIRHKGELRAFVNECRHISIPLDYGDAQFFTTDKKYLFCRNHGAVYEPLTGECLGGPCGGEPLFRLDVEERSGEILVKIPENLGRG